LSEFHGRPKKLRRKSVKGKYSLSGFYETAVECKDIALVFLLLGFFVFAVVFAVSFAGTTRTLRRIHLGLLYALEESRQGLGA
jgi:hypothetical protein